MMSIEKSGKAFFIVEKDTIVQRIKESKKELKMLGTTSIGLPWQENHSELYELLYNKCALGNSNLLFYKASEISEISFSPLFFTFIL